MASSPNAVSMGAPVGRQNLSFSISLFRQVSVLYGTLGPVSSIATGYRGPLLCRRAWKRGNVLMRQIEKLGHGPVSFSEPRDLGSTNFDVSINGSALWCVRRRHASPSVTLDQLNDQQQIDEYLLRGNTAVHWKVLASDHESVFCLGGDLALFLDCIARRDEATLLDYGLKAAHCVWMNSSGFGPRRVGTIAVVEGEAQGGGFEAALSCHWIVASTNASFGFPESLFGIRPGMGALPLLSIRVGQDVAEMMVSRANRYSAAFLHELGVVDELVEPGDGRLAVDTIIGRSNNDSAKHSQLKAIPFEHLVTDVEKWVDDVMATSARHQRSMRYLLDAQERRSVRNAR